MKVIKPLRLGVLTRPFENKGKVHFAVGTLTYFSLGPSPRVYADVDLWKALPDVLPPKLESNRFTETERGLLLADGISTVRVGAGGVVYTESVLTTWQVNELDIEDDSFQWIETLRCASYFRQDMLVFLGSRFKDHKVADDETPIGPGQKVATPALVRAAVLGRYALYERQAICEGGAEFADSLVVERHANDPGRMDILSYPDFVNQLRNIAVRESFIV